MTGYAFATAIIGAAVFVDRVLYGGPDEQRLALGALAGATAVGALVSGLLVRALGPRLVSLVGIALAVAGLLWMATLDRGDADRAGRGRAGDVRPRLRPDGDAALERGHRGGGPRPTAPASSTVTVARMLGMAVGLAILTANGSTTIDRLSAAGYATPEAYQAVIPPECATDHCAIRSSSKRSRRGRRAKPRRSWSGCTVAAIVTIVAIPPCLALGAGRPATDPTARDARMLTPDGTDADPAH